MFVKTELNFKMMFVIALKGTTYNLTGTVREATFSVNASETCMHFFIQSCAIADIYLKANGSTQYYIVHIDDTAPMWYAVLR